ncbi:MAG: primosomal protein N' [Firmicutes bacterium]|nr:primosomal protein N' [Bacillota bacterium]
MIATVVIDAVLSNDDKVFDYIIPAELAEKVYVGSRVMVPFGPRDTEGFVLGIKETTDFDKGKLKAIQKSPDEFVAIKPEFIEILDDTCAKFCLRKIDVIRLFVPSTVRGRKRTRKVENKELKSLEIHDKQITLTKHQQDVISKITTANNTFVLHGVTGSGKTEVYMNVIKRALESGKTAIMLVPEIGLTPQVLGNFRTRFGDNVAMIHSGLSPTERYDQWLTLHNGQAKIVIGARSAIFAPMENVGIIIIDEEHDTSYFSESNPRFYTHEVAKLRARFNACPLVLGSATPSIETMHKATMGEYTLLTLDRRVNNLEMPKVTVICMADEIRAGHGGVFSRALLAKLDKTIEEKKQAMIFLNRRGFSSYVMCKGCGWVARCDNCDVSLVYHKDDGQLKCHYCPSRFTVPKRCQQCSGTHLKYGAVGTQKLVEELSTIFPNIPIFRLDADNTKTKDSLIEILSNFAKTTPSILVGTQMIAKGHHFPHVNVVGIVDADNSLHFSDYRAVERTFALITQVSGRAGREGHEGSVYIQTYMPNHYVYRLAANYDYNKFFERELNTRITTKFPPFTTIVRILVTGEVDRPIKDLIQRVMTKLRERIGDFVYLGAMKSPLGRIQNKFRYQILCRFAREKESDIINFVNGILKGENVSKGTFMFMEINPQNLS